ncbi:MAG: DUF1501 domain-containing protein, partial [Verrucomicrobia bacterium]|nr:DUF1501 domain-containing protein [Verrucomicrobiota bacterium]
MSRRDMLAASGGGFGLLALAGLFGPTGAAAGAGSGVAGGSSLDSGVLTSTHSRARARSVIFLYQDGRPSQ